MKPETAKRLHDVRIAGGEVQGFCVGRSRARLHADRGLQLIVQKLIENIGEALRRVELLEPELAREIPDLRQIVDTRNRLVHGYDDVDYDILWDIVQVEIPELLLQVENLFSRFPLTEEER